MRARINTRILTSIGKQTRVVPKYFDLPLWVHAQLGLVNHYGGILKNATISEKKDASKDNLLFAGAKFVYLYGSTVLCELYGLLASLVSHAFIGQALKECVE